jgi:hypothetical protein
MAQKLYKLCLIRGWKEAFYRLSEEEKQRLYQQVGTAIEKAGAKMASPYYNCRWSNDKYLQFFIMEYPNLDSAMQDTSGVEAIELFRYLDSETILGVVENEPANS